VLPLNNSPATLLRAAARIEAACWRKIRHVGRHLRGDGGDDQVDDILSAAVV
jgi:hypothetical protein